MRLYILNCEYWSEKWKWTVRPRSHCAICDCDLVLLTMGCVGAGDVVTVTWCEHFHWFLYNPLVAIGRYAVAIRNKRTVWTGLQFHTDLPSRRLVCLFQVQEELTRKYFGNQSVCANTAWLCSYRFQRGLDNWESLLWNISLLHTYVV